MAEPYVVLEDGVVTNDPSVPVINLDVLTADVPIDDEVRVEQVEALREQAAQFQSLGWVVDRCNRWLDRHDPIRRVPVSAPRYEEEW